MATGRIGVTPTLGVRWSKAPTGNTTALSGLDDSSVSLVYSVGYEQVYRNGVLLSRGNDYTATTGTTITLIDATITGDIIEVFAQQLVPLADAISKGQFTAKGTLLSATAASTPGVLGVGANGTVLTAASGQATGLEWATPSAGGMTLINSGGTTLTGASVTISSIPGTYKNLQLIVRNFKPATDDAYLEGRYNSDANARYGYGSALDSANANPNNTQFDVSLGNDNSVDYSLITVDIFDYANTSTWKCGYAYAFTVDAVTTTKYNFKQFFHIYNQVGAITSMTIKPSAGNFTSGTAFLYGVS